MNFFHKAMFFALAFAGALHMPGYAHAAEIGKTVAVFEDPSHAPCKIVTGSKVYCHIHGTWQLRKPVELRRQPAKVAPKPHSVQAKAATITKSAIVAEGQRNAAAAATVALAVRDAAFATAFDFEFVGKM